MVYSGTYASLCLARMTALIFRYFSGKRLPADDEAESMVSRLTMYLVFFDDDFLSKTCILTQNIS